MYLLASTCGHSSGHLALQFKDFLKCTVANAEYYAPFLEMLGGPEDPEDGEEGLVGDGSAQPV